MTGCLSNRHVVLRLATSLWRHCVFFSRLPLQGSIWCTYCNGQHPCVLVVKARLGGGGCLELKLGQVTPSCVARWDARRRTRARYASDIHEGAAFFGGGGCPRQFQRHPVVLDSCTFARAKVKASMIASDSDGGGVSLSAVRMRMRSRGVLTRVMMLALSTRRSMCECEASHRRSHGVP
jgi:hypothetical protein